MKLALKNCLIINHNESFEANILIEDEKIKDITNEDINGDNVIDCHNKAVLPGIIDMHVHFRDPGFEYKEDIISGSRAAVAGGITTCLPMANTYPVNDNAGMTRYMVERNKKLGLVDLLPIGSITKKMEGKELVEMGDMLKAGAIAFSDDGLPVGNSEVMRRSMEYAKGFGSFIISHSEDRELSQGGMINEGEISTITGLSGIPSASEDIGVARDILLAKLTKSHIHICHVSSKVALKIIKMAKKERVNVSCEVTPHHFSFTEESLLDYNTNYKMNPPLRSTEDQEMLICGMKDGTIDVIATDHAPHHTDEKHIEFGNAAFGIIGLQTLIPLSLKLVKDKKIDLNDFVRLTSYNPSKILKLDDRGSIEKGKLADIIVIDKDKEYIFDDTINQSKSCNNPLYNTTLKGCALYTIKKGRLVYKFPDILI